MLTVIAKLKVKPGLEEKFQEEFLPIVEFSNEEEGCLNYALHQSIEDKCLFVLYENWASQEALDEHLNKPYMKAITQKADQFLAAPLEMNLWNKIS